MSEQRVTIAHQDRRKLPRTPQDRRKLPRKRIVQRGEIVYGEGRFTLSCLIRSISPKGARISVEKGHSMPTHVYLIDVLDGMAYASEVMWMRSPLFGLKFLRTYNLAELNERDLRYLKRFWLNLAR
jgi:hypothetical protein